MTPLQTRKDKFYDECAKVMIEFGHTKERARRFYEHWIQMNPGEKLMWFEKIRRGGCFETSKRMATFKRKEENNFGCSNGSGYPGYYDSKFEKTLQGNNILKYHSHLINLGWKKVHPQSGGTVWNKPLK